jgi:hypothetical protein
MMSEHTMLDEETRQRLNRMERELRHWRLGTFMTLSLAAVVVAGAMADPPTPELRVRTLRVVDKDGRDRIILTAEPGVPDMTFLDRSGKSRLTLDIADDHKPVLLFSEAGQTQGRITLGIEEGAPMLRLFDSMGKKRAEFGILKEGIPALRIFDSNEKYRTRFP